MPELGELIGGKYRLTRRLGRGGMGAVYEAIHEQIGKAVAVKVLLPQAVSRDEVVARFHQEAQAASAAGHRGIVDIHDVGICADGAPYLVMELLQGQALSERLLAAGQLSTAETAYVVCQVLSALSAAHLAGIVHRDLKPENVFLAHSGAPLPEVKLLDFGISRVLRPEGPDMATRMTRSGVVMGTPHFMSPEQAAGKKDVDHRTDLYSMAVIVFQCLTGDLPHDGENYNALMASIISDPPRRPSEVMEEIAPALEALILRGLCKDRQERYGTAAEMFWDLRPFVDTSAVAALRMPVTPSGASAMSPTLPEAEPPDRAPTQAASVAEAPTEAVPKNETPTAAEPLASGRRSPEQLEPSTPPPPTTIQPVPTTTSTLARPGRGRGLVLALLLGVVALGLGAGGAVVLLGGGGQGSAAPAAPEPAERAPASVTPAPPALPLAEVDASVASPPAAMPAVDASTPVADAEEEHRAAPAKVAPRRRPRRRDRPETPEPSPTPTRTDYGQELGVDSSSGGRGDYGQELLE